MDLYHVFERFMTRNRPSRRGPTLGLISRDDGELISGHMVERRRVAAYETHWIAGMEFLFAIVRWPGERFRIYILKQPSYGGRKTNSVKTHRLSDGAYHKNFICIDHRAYPNTLTEARELALMWAQATARYIVTGQDFG